MGYPFFQLTKSSFQKTFKKCTWRDFLVVQGLRLHVSKAGNESSIHIELVGKLRSHMLCGVTKN